MSVYDKDPYLIKNESRYKIKSSIYKSTKPSLMNTPRNLSSLELNANYDSVSKGKEFYKRRVRPVEDAIKMF
jgi:hypothetical protein